MKALLEDAYRSLLHSFEGSWFQPLSEDLKPLVIESDAKNRKQINRMHYELCLFQALRERLCCKEIWIEGANRYRNPDEDLPRTLRQDEISITDFWNFQ